MRGAGARIRPQMAQMTQMNARAWVVARRRAEEAVSHG